MCSRRNCDRRIDRRNLCNPHYIASGQAHGYVDAGPARERLKVLRGHGLTIVMLETYGVTRSVIARVDRREQQIHRLTEQRILNIPIPISVIPSGAEVPALGTVRRLQALAAIGWPQTVMADRLGMTQSMLGNRMGRTHVTAKTAAMIADLFTELQSVPGPSQISRQRAIAKGWEPPFAWDEESIDDPSAELGKPVPSTASERIQELHDLGIRDVYRIAERLGIKPASVERQLYPSRANVNWDTGEESVA